MLEHKILKAFLNRETYEAHRKYVISISDKMKPWFDTVDWWHKNRDTNLSVQDLYDVHMTMFNRVATKQQRDLIDQTFELIEQAEVNSQVIETLIVENHRQNLMSKAAEKIARLSEKGDSDLSDVIKELEEIKGNHTIGNEFPPMVITAEDMVETTAHQGRWRFHLPILQEKIGGIGPGVFGLLAARPNGGKSLAAISSCFHPEGFAAQGARIAYIANEELVHRHKSRAVCAFTGFEHGVLSNASRILLELRIKERRGETVDPELRGKAEADIQRFNEAANAFDERFKDSVMFYHETGMAYQKIERLIEEQKPDIVIVDQLDKLHIQGDAPSHEKMRILYTSMREYSSNHGVAIIGICQASEAAAGRKYFSFDALEHSKTGKGAELDLCICIGQEDLHEDNNVRYFYLAKNKLTGNESSGSYMINKQQSRMVV